MKHVQLTSSVQRQEITQYWCGRTSGAITKRKLSDPVEMQTVVAPRSGKKASLCSPQGGGGGGQTSDLIHNAAKILKTIYPSWQETQSWERTRIIKHAIMTEYSRLQTLHLSLNGDSHLNFSCQFFNLLVTRCHKTQAGSHGIIDTQVECLYGGLLSKQ